MCGYTPSVQDMHRHQRIIFFLFTSCHVTSGLSHLAGDEPVASGKGPARKALQGAENLNGNGGAGKGRAKKGGGSGKNRGKGTQNGARTAL